jgi:indolepyruvate ferredoxin oxidoreductase
VVTLGAVIGAAAALENKNVTSLDMAGLAQKGGPVTTHIRIAQAEAELHATRISSGETTVLIGCDLVVSASPDTIFKLRPNYTRAVVNNDFSITSEFVRTFAAQAKTGDLTAHPDPVFPHEMMEKVIADACGAGRADFLPGSRLATALLGDSIATNPFLLGYAFQKGLLPLRGSSILQAIENLGVAIQQNRNAFHWGRRAAQDYAAVERAAGLRREAEQRQPIAERPLNDMIDALAAELRVRAAEARIGGTAEKLTRAFALGYFKLLAFKDEYEVARLYTQPGFREKLQATFEGDYQLAFHFAPPILSSPGGSAHGPRKRRFGGGMIWVLRVLAALRFLRGTMFDPFSRSPDRQSERRLIHEYENMISEILPALRLDNLATAIELAALPQRIRGYGAVKERYAAQAKKHEAELKRRFAAQDNASEFRTRAASDA